MMLMVDIIPVWGQDKAVAETWMLRSISGFAALVIISVSTNLKCCWTASSGHKYKGKNNHAQLVVGPHLIVVLTSVVP